MLLPGNAFAVCSLMHIWIWGVFHYPPHVPCYLSTISVHYKNLKKYVDNWEKMKRNHIGCLFWGPVGTGKSYVAGCIANDLLKREVTVKMTNFNTIIDDIFPLADKTEYINALASYQLLIIDDLGVERNSEYALGIIFSVIDRRIRSGRPLIITTNLPLEEIKSETMLDKRRIYDRILEMCTPMYVGGTSKREAIASMKMEKAKTLLNTNRGEEKCEWIIQKKQYLFGRNIL